MAEPDATVDALERSPPGYRRVLETGKELR